MLKRENTYVNFKTDCADCYTENPLFVTKDKTVLMFVRVLEAFSFQHSIETPNLVERRLKWN